MSFTLTLLYTLEWLFHIKARLKSLFGKYYFLSCIFIIAAVLVICDLAIKRNNYNREVTVASCALGIYLFVPFDLSKKNKK